MPALPVSEYHSMTDANSGELDIPLTVCDHCGGKCNVSDAAIGQIGTCPHCQKRFQVRAAAPPSDQERPVATVPDEASKEEAIPSLSTGQALSAYGQWFKRLPLAQSAALSLGLVVTLTLASVGFVSLFDRSGSDNPAIEQIAANPSPSTPTEVEVPADQPPPQFAAGSIPEQPTSETLPSRPSSQESPTSAPPTQQPQPQAEIGRPAVDQVAPHANTPAGAPDPSTEVESSPVPELQPDPKFAASPLSRQLAGKWVHSQGVPWVSILQVNEDGSVVFQPGTKFPFRGVCQLVSPGQVRFVCPKQPLFNLTAGIHVQGNNVMLSGKKNVILARYFDVNPAVANGNNPAVANFELSGRWGKVHSGLPAMFDLYDDGIAIFYSNSRPIPGRWTRDAPKGAQYRFESAALPTGVGLGQSNVGPGGRTLTVRTEQGDSAMYQYAQQRPSDSQMRMIRNVQAPGDMLPDLLDFGAATVLRYQYLVSAQPVATAGFRTVGGRTLNLIGIPALGSIGRSYSYRMNEDELVLGDTLQPQLEVKYTRIAATAEIPLAESKPATPVNTPRSQRPPRDYGPLLKGNAYRLLGEWTLGRKGNSGFPGRIAFLEDGQVVFSLEDQADSATPILGSYQLLDDGTLELTSSGDSKKMQFKFMKQSLVLADAKKAQVARAYRRDSEMPVAHKHPEIGSQKREANGELSLFEAMRLKLVELTVMEHLDTNRFKIDIAKSAACYGGQLWLHIEPGTPVRVDTPQKQNAVLNVSYVSPDPSFYIVSAVQDDYRAADDQPVNRLVLRDPGSSTCRMSLYAFHPTAKPLEEIQNGRNLFVYDQLRWLKLDSAEDVFREEFFDQYDANLEQALRIAGTVWKELGLNILRLKYMDIPANVDGWPRTVDLVERLLEIKRPADAKDQSLIGLWRIEPAPDAATPQVSPIRLLLQDKGQFALMYHSPGSFTTPGGEYRFHGVQGTWKLSGSQVTCTPQQEEPDGDTPAAFPRNSTKTTPIVFRRSGDQLQVKLAGANVTTLSRHNWMIGEPAATAVASTSPENSAPTNSAPNALDASGATEFGKQKIGKNKLTLITMTGRPVPGTPPGAHFATLGVPVINSQGEVAFEGQLRGNSLREYVNDQLTAGCFVTQGQTLRAVGVDGAKVPELDDKARLRFADSTGLVSLDDSGNVYFQTDVQLFVGAMRRAIVVHNGERLKILTRDQMPVSEGSEETIRTCHVSSLRVVSPERVWFHGSRSKNMESSCQALFYGTPGQLNSAVALPGPTPDGAGTWTDSGLSRPTLLIGKSGVALNAAFRTPESGRTSMSSIWAGLPSELKCIVQDGDEVSFGNLEATVDNVWLEGTNPQGDVLMNLLVKRPYQENVGIIDSRGLWLYSDGKLNSVMAPNQIADNLPEKPGMSSTQSVLNSQGEVAAIVSTTTGLKAVGQRNILGRRELKSIHAESIWFWSHGKWEMLMNIPWRRDHPSGFETLAMNAQGQVLVKTRDDRLLLLQAKERTAGKRDEEATREIIRAGEVLEVAPGDRRIVKSFSAPLRSGGSDGRQRSLNADGQVAFQVVFLDASEAIFLFSPED